jgi:hydroxymethylpyrimidine/phosphomethylpyrimidine kinase
MSRKLTDLPPRLLTIAGSDSGGGAGIQADLKTFGAFGGFGMSAITAITAQNTRRVAAVQLLRPTIIERQIATVATDLGIDAGKTGMLGSAPIVRAVARAVQRYRIRPLVVDPVMVSASGARLLDREGVVAMARELLPLASVVTPNLAEASDLCGKRIESSRDMEWAAKALGDHLERAVLIKGGHRAQEPVDILWDGVTLTRFRGRRIRSRSTHGTGCTLSAAIAALLGWGLDLVEAIARAKAYVQGAIETAPGLGAGVGPLNHGWRGVARLRPRRRR